MLLLLLLACPLPVASQRLPPMPLRQGQGPLTYLQGDVPSVMQFSGTRAANPSLTGNTFTPKQLPAKNLTEIRLAAGPTTTQCTTTLCDA